MPTFSNEPQSDLSSINGGFNGDKKSERNVNSMHKSPPQIRLDHKFSKTKQVELADTPRN